MKNNQNNDLNKWKDIKTTFLNGVAQGSTSTVIVSALAVAALIAAVAAALAVASVVAAGAAVATSVAVAAVATAAAAGVANVVANASGAGAAKQERPSIRKLGYAFGLALPIVVGGITCTMIYNASVEKKITITASARANCSHDEVKDEIKKLENAGFLVTLQCK